ncbi:MAG TPA: ferrochelatase [Terriglobales bacterium]|jgi:ferrochelatase|nr:ferrochelatase [Terriglobales bacterium]
MNEIPKNSTAILLLAHGSPDSPQDVKPFLLKVTGGRPLPPEVVQEVTRRYETIGKSPLTAITLKQGELLAVKLKMPVYVGMRNWRPFVSDVLRKMVADSVHHAIVICLAPQNSRTSVGLYRTSLRACDDPKLTFDFVESWHDQPRLIQAFAEKLKAGRNNARKEAGRNVPVIFTAHSVPSHTVLEGDPYEVQARQTAELVAKAAALEDREWRFAFQSQGMSGGAWLGPTVEATIMDLKRSGFSGVFVQPIGFLCDHVEILYDIDVVFKQFAQEQAMQLWRAESLNESQLLTAALADVAKSRLATSKSA